MSVKPVMYETSPAFLRLPCFSSISVSVIISTVLFSFIMSDIALKISLCEDTKKSSSCKNPATST